jgi:hypothetical protein
MISESGNKIPVQIGKKYLAANQGNPPKIIFVPETGPGRITPPLSMGHAVACCVHSCDVHVRAKPGITEEGRFDEAYTLADMAIGAVGLAASGRVKWGGFGDDSLNANDGSGSGVGLKFSFTFERNVPHFDKFWTLPESVKGTERDTRTPTEITNFEPSGARVPAVELEIAAVITPTVTPEE